MKHLKGIHDLSDVGPVVASVGMFDGVHRAHQALLSMLHKRATALGGTYALITFWPHPQHVLRGACEPRLLLTEEEKVAKLKELGLPYLITLPFDSTFAGYDKHFFFGTYTDKRHRRTLSGDWTKSSFWKKRSRYLR